MNKKPTAGNWAVIVLLSLIWGSSYILMKRGLESFTWDQVGAMRIGFSAIILSPVMFLRRSELTRKKAGWLFVIAILGNGFPPFLYPLAQTHMDSSVAGILNALTPVWTLLVGAVLFKTRYAWLQMLGIVIAFGGSAALIWLRPAHTAAHTDMRYGWFVVIATLFYGLSVNGNQHKLHNMRPISIAAFCYGMIGIPALIYLFTTDALTRLHTQPKAIVSLGAIALLSAFGTALAQSLYNRLIQQVGGLMASIVTYLMPIVSLAWGAADSERVGILHIICLLAILAGVYLVSVRKRDTEIATEELVTESI